MSKQAKQGKKTEDTDSSIRKERGTITIDFMVIKKIIKGYY